MEQTMSEDDSVQTKHWGRGTKTGPWDAIVIGSGIGGMVAAALLSKLGRRVLVLEQHYVPGGFTHTFRRRHYEWDAGVHAVGEVTERSMPGRLLSSLTDGRLQWASLGPVYDSFHLPDGMRVDFPDNPAQFRENLVSAFPKESAAIDAYLRLVKEVSGDMRNYYLSRTLPPSLGPVTEKVFARKARRFLSTTTAQVVSGLTSDPRLAALLSAQWGYCGSPPSRSSFAMQALIAKHFMWGGYYPVGGSSSIARQLLRTVSDGGGWTSIRSDAQEIIVEGGRAVGVRLSNGQEVRAPIIVSAIGASSTVTRLLPETFGGKKWAREVGGLKAAPAHVCLYMGFRGDIRKAGAGPNNLWFYESWNSENDSWHVTPNARNGDAPVLYVSFPSLKDPLHDAGEAVRHTGEIVTFVPWETFLPWREQRWRKRGADYQSFKDDMRNAMLEQLFRRLPELRGMLDYAELSTPITTDHFLRPPNGSIYGLESTPERFGCKWLRARTPLPGLFFAGVDVSAPGVIGGAMGGALAALSAAPMDAYRWLRANAL